MWEASRAVQYWQGLDNKPLSESGKSAFGSKLLLSSGAVVADLFTQCRYSRFGIVKMVREPCLRHNFGRVGLGDIHIAESIDRITTSRDISAWGLFRGQTYVIIFVSVIVIAGPCRGGDDSKGTEAGKSSASVVLGLISS